MYFLGHFPPGVVFTCKILCWTNTFQDFHYLWDHLGASLELSQLSHTWKVTRKVPQRVTKVWVWSFFAWAFYEELISSSCTGPILRIRWNFWDFLLSSLKPWKNFRIWNSICAWDLMSWILDWPMQGQLGPPILVGQARKPACNSPTLWLKDMVI
jgi:hypothetical protein